MIKNRLKYLAAFILGMALLFLTGCSTTSEPELRVAATSVPHGEILEFIKPLLNKKGINLNIVLIEDYNTPNRALHDREVDANFFQHLPFLEAQKRDFGYRLSSIAKVHLEPMALYSKKFSIIDNLKMGSLIAIPSDPSNQARALNMLEQQKLITFKKTAQDPSILDIAKNENQIKFLEIDSSLLARTLEDVDAAAITTNFALQAGLSPLKDTLATENAQSSFVNVLVVREGEQDRADIQALKEALTSPDVKAFIEAHYQGSIIPAF
ncbi:MAG: MetQ/NlpA family ABC transporter substrate-binding protein [Candidatus Protochlamydia sp.]|nr:MetQ/NlpA family ABC transporter substrate-binding protein [Candidatus Protochlamydia sp.]